MNKPLTVEELKELEVGDWVWLINTAINEQEYVKIENAFDFVACKNSRRLVGKYLTCYFEREEYGTRWLAYKNKEQAENN